jgi:hypothetical protein
MPFSPNSSSCPKKLSSEYQAYAYGNFFGHFSILEKIAILGQPPRGPFFSPLPKVFPPKKKRGGIFELVTFFVERRRRIL